MKCQKHVIAAIAFVVISLASLIVTYPGIFVAHAQRIRVDKPTDLVVISPSTPPILESIFVSSSLGGERIVAQNTGGDYYVFPCTSLELRVRAQLGVGFRIYFNTQQLQLVSNRSPRSDLDASGYFSVTQEAMPGGQEGFYRIWVVPPIALRAWPRTATDLQIQSLNPGGPLSTFASFAAVDFPFFTPHVARVEPSSVFDDGWNSKNSRDLGPWQAHAKQSIIARKVTLAGWLVHNPSPTNSGIFVERPDQSEDWHYTIWLDPDFIERTYGGHTSAQPLAGAILPGNPSNFFPWLNPGANDIPLLSPGAVPDVGTFLITAHQDFAVELNAWHRSKRGTPPAGWIGDPRPGFGDNAWPFPPRLPFNDGSGRDLQEGDYVIVSGTLWQDSGHRPKQGEDGFEERECWNNGFRGQDGWLEIHPVDMVRRQASPKIRKHTHTVTMCAPPNQTKSIVSRDLTPVEPYVAGKKLKWKEYVDARFSKGGRNVLANVVTDSNGANPRLRVSGQVGGAQGGSFKATYVLWWE